MEVGDMGACWEYCIMFAFHPTTDQCSTAHYTAYTTYSTVCIHIAAQMLWLWIWGTKKIHTEEQHLFQTLQGIWWIDYSGKGCKDCIKTSADLPHEKGEQSQPGHWQPRKVSSDSYTSIRNGTVFWADYKHKKTWLQANHEKWPAIRKTYLHLK